MPPFDINVNEVRAFSRHGIPWDDENAAGVDVLWLTIPPGEPGSFPPWALVLNSYSSCSSTLCLISTGGKVLTSRRDLGIVQEVFRASIAPSRNPQLLVLSNPDRATGYLGGEFQLLEFDGRRLRSLVRGPRYSTRDVDQQEVRMAYPLVVGDDGRRLIVPVFRLATHERAESHRLSDLECDCELLEYTWDPGEARYREAAPSSRPLLHDLSGAWDWRAGYKPEAEDVGAIRE
jgi:hypothetical protein